MGLIGKAAMVAWHDLQPGCEAEHDAWHSREHLFERVAIPGFLRGRRCRAVDAEEEYFLMYEVDDLGVLTSRAYHSRLNSPTAWSKKIIPKILHMTRTLCRVLASLGNGVGTMILTVRFSAPADARPIVIQRFTERLLPEFVGREGIVGVHLLEGDDAASGVKTDEMQLRGGGDRCADLVLLVEAFDADALIALADEQLTSRQFVENGAEAGIHRGLYRAGHIVSEVDLPP
jgi:hypothetical protein